ncbi:hypothetical protein EDC01DRAFT_742943 [Geopyxis carbonaria]|nr:hypothetical protein EDC01DRAFT_742943 [Geopyxis carbonaria]
MSQFVGLTVLVTLKTDGTQLRGLVAGVIQTEQENELSLRNEIARMFINHAKVVFPRTGQIMNDFRVNGRTVSDVEIVPENYLPANAAPHLLSQPPPTAYSMHEAVQHVIPPHVAPQFASQQQQQQQQQQQPYNHSIPPVNAPPVAVAPVQPYANHHASNMSFEDPAILSMSRKPPTKVQAPTVMQPVHPEPPRHSVPPTPTPVRAPVAPVMAKVSSSRGGIRSNRASSSKLDALAIPAGPKAHDQNPLSANAAVEGSMKMESEYTPPVSAAAALQRPFSTMNIRGDPADSSAVDETDDGFNVPNRLLDQQNNFSGKRSRRGKGNFKRQQQRQPTHTGPNAQDEEGNITPESSTGNNVLQPGMFGGAIAKAAVSQAGAHSKQRNRRPQRTRRQRGYPETAEEEGWATEDVNDYKATEFDFQGNLDRFDKKTVFSQIKASDDEGDGRLRVKFKLTNNLKAEDTTADEERLVSHNRLPNRSYNRSSVFVKKNYHPTENVLGTYANGQSLADRDDWQQPDFGVAEESEDSDGIDMDMRGRGNGNAADSGRSSRRAMSRQSISNRRATRQLSNTANISRASVENLQSLSSGPNNGSSGVATKSGKPSLRLEPSGRPCPIISPLQMLDVERIAEVELGLTDDMMTENAGRGIAQVAIQAFGKRISASNHNALPVVLVFAGNNKTGARAIAAGRHLKNHHVRVMVCVLGLEREDELLENIRRQLNIFRNAGGRVARWEEMQANLKTLDSPPELIIDGLLGMHVGFEDLRSDDQVIAYELAQFANKSKANVLSVDIPSGIDGTTGVITTLAEDSGMFYFRSNWVVCMGAPKSGVLHALTGGHGSSWKLYVADIGISNTAWRKYGTRRRHGVEFAADWVVSLQYHGSVSA